MLFNAWDKKYQLLIRLKKQTILSEQRFGLWFTG